MGTLQKEDMSATESLRDHFLIAMPSLEGSIFSHSVTYLCDHSEHGAMGIIINQPMDITMGDVFDQLQLSRHSAHRSQPVLAGGPVNLERGFVLHRQSGQWQSTLKITDEICLTASKDIVTAISRDEGPKNALFALGYAGWAPGQLESEIAENSWLTLPADSNIIFDVPIEERWAATAKQLGIDMNLISSIAGHA